jgi:hypothetical protein
MLSTLSPRHLSQRHSTVLGKLSLCLAQNLGQVTHDQLIGSWIGQLDSLDLKGRSAVVNEGGLDLYDGLLVDGTRWEQMLSCSTTESPGESTAGRSRSRTWSILAPARETVP